MTYDILYYKIRSGRFGLVWVVLNVLATARVGGWVGSI